MMYVINYTENSLYHFTVEADTEDEAKEKFDEQIEGGVIDIDSITPDDSQGEYWVDEVEE